MQPIRDELEILVGYGLKICACFYGVKGGEKMFCFAKGGKRTVKWKWLRDDPQLPMDQIIEPLGASKTLAGVIPDKMAVIDTDDSVSSGVILEYLESRGIRTFYEKSKSCNEENQKHHFYFRSKSPLPYVTEFQEIGVKGKGEILGTGHLVIINPDGWQTNPSLVKELPFLPDEFCPKEPNKDVSQIKNDKPPATVEYVEGIRNNTLFKIGCGLRHKGVSEENIFSCLSAINAQCDPPLSDKELLRIANSTSNYEIGNKHTGFNHKYNLKKIKEKHYENSPLRDR
ncbi:MAG: primase alpha helix C-terminal domain-containing protein [Candidatus Saganbacteria bacterium]|nr:primase alpha helix C-terminal domain-containing protein [Candidatus Saganbacteria bacterium]